jgi:hypothetical protein
MDIRPRFSVRDWVLPVVLSVILMAETASADVINGSFDDGATGWSTSADPSDLLAVTFPTIGGDPGSYALLSGNGGGTARLSQSFLCGDPGGGTECTITFQYKLFDLLLSEPGTARIAVTIDGFQTVLVDHSQPNWTTATFVAPCGQHTLEIVLVIDPGDNSWGASIDNVHAACAGTVDDQARSWGGVKGMYR